MLATIFAMLATVSPPSCETFAPRIDGTEVTVCSGRVVRVGLAPRVWVETIDSHERRARVVSETGATWEIDSAQLPANTTEGDVVMLGRSKAVRVNGAAL
jgi:hypothetical protein